MDIKANVKANCDLVNESIEASLHTKKKWILIRKHWYKLELKNKTLKCILPIQSLKLYI